MNYNIILAKRKCARALLVDKYNELTYNNRDIRYTLELSELVDLAKLTKVRITVRGGGQSAQLQSARLALAKYIVKLKPELKPVLLQISPTILTSDRRRKQSKNPECKGARRRRQKSYR